MKSGNSADVASILDNYITALIALERKVTLSEDDMILINVGISGIGLAAVDLATNVFKAKVYFLFYFTFIYANYFTSKISLNREKKIESNAGDCLNISVQLQRSLEFALQKAGPIELGRWGHLRLSNTVIRN